MATLVSLDAAGGWVRVLTAEREVREALQVHGLGYGRWPLRDIGDGGLDAVRRAYAVELAELGERLDLRSLDRVAMWPGRPEWPALRQQFLTEHTHADPEVRYFLGGRGLFHVRTPDHGLLALLCEAEDWVAIPAGTPHGFDAGASPGFDALRLFSSAAGWQATPTGGGASRGPLLEEFLDQLTRQAAPQAI